MNRLVLLLLALLTFPLASFAGDEETLRDYLPRKRIVRFEGPVHYWIGGQDRLEGQYYVETVVNELSRIIPGLSLTEVSSKSQAEVRFYLTDSNAEWQETITSSAEGVAGWQEMGERIRGFTRLVVAPTGRVKRADIVLHLDFQTSGGQKLWVVRHEMMHALGIDHHPSATTDTVLNSRQAQEDKNSYFSDADILVLQTMYGPHATAGASW